MVGRVLARAKATLARSMGTRAGADRVMVLNCGSSSIKFQVTSIHQLQRKCSPGVGPHV